MGTETKDSVDPNLQAMWDALGILGFDLDGDPTPSASLISGPQAFRENFLRRVREVRREHDAAVEEVCMDPGAHDDEAFCPKCFAGTESPEHLTRCAS